QPFIPIQNAVLDSVLLEKSAGIAGLQKGDSIISFNDQEIGYWHELSPLSQDAKNKEVEIVFKRDDEIKSVKVTPDEDGLIGVTSKRDNFGSEFLFKIYSKKISFCFEVI
ncbi:MAG: hypothetical protein ABR572_13610, partial [Cryomorphaceae bacterium]